jgi:hypothetical protein
MKLKPLVKKYEINKASFKGRDSPPLKEAYTGDITFYNIFCIRGELSTELKLVGILHYICRRSGFGSRSSHSSTLMMKFLDTRLLDKKKKLLKGCVPQNIR